ncbi:hypothetical protein JTE90_018117 [Oedothorax gibbosus]|uniref:TIR domain-containing protein n=1 Tax=Oedothorax gibbosus TaxID=931172 RepID=A0AAV6UYZ0_9ARAC|nr:hypothetical protein JTE90_018117 [Oedothorax gibbosus]
MRFFWMACLHVFTLALHCNTEYSAPEDCDWTGLGSGDVSLICNLKAIVASGVFATNFSIIQSTHTTALTVQCGPHFLESSMAPKSLSHLRHLKDLRIKQCKMRILPEDVFFGLSDLKNLTIHTMNDVWGEFGLSLDSDSFTDLHQIETLDISHNKLEVITDEVVCPLDSLKRLYLTHNALTSVISFSNNSVKHCARSLSELDVSHNKISVVSKEDFTNFQNLRSLKLAHNQLNNIDAMVFSELANLQIVDLSNNELSLLPTVLYQNSPDIRALYLHNNSIFSLPPGIFSGLQQLGILNLSLNQISSLSLETFVDLIRLVILDLRGNKLTSLDSALFQSQYSLQMLHLSHNHIDIIAENTFSSLYNLYSLDLGENSLRHLDILTLNGLYVLSDLRLSFNRISSVHPDVFKNCSSIENIDLQGNRLDHIPIALRSLQFLRSLNLNNNSIKSLDDSSFQDLKQLHHLRISKNELENVTKDTFKHLKSLKSIDLSQNQIRNLEHGIFDYLEVLSEVNLSDNYLEDINGIFMTLTNLVSLNVSRNKIQWFDYAVIPTELNELDMHSNEIKTLSNYYELEDTLKLRELDVSFNHISEISSISFPNHISKLKINNNHISIVKPFTFMAKVNLSFVNMADNNIETLDINAFRLNANALGKPNFAISGNPFFCDCNVEWLQHMNKIDGTFKHPHIIDLNDVVCKLSFKRKHFYMPLSKAKSSDFLCEYRSQCFALCHCCEYDACDCEMICPENCVCYSDQTWNTNIVDCSWQNFSSMPPVIPMDVTDLYLDGNNMFQLTSHILIGRKNTRVIYLNNSNIHIIDNQTFNGLLILKSLHLELNQLKSLHGYEFEPLIHLEELYLSNNKIAHISNTTFQKLKSLKILNLDHNLIKEFQVWNLNWNPHLINIRLGHNPWICDCNYLESYHDWLLSESSKVTDLGSIQCHFNLSAGPYLIKFNLSFCSNHTSVTFFQAILQTYYVTAFIIAIPVILLVLLVSVIYRTALKVWLGGLFASRTPESKKAFDAFVCYSKKDEYFVSQSLVPELECGVPFYRLCLQHRDLCGGSVSEAIQGSHRTLLVLTEHFECTELPECKLIVVLVDENPTLCFPSAQVIRWGDKRFWEKLKYAMPSKDSSKLIV